MEDDEVDEEERELEEEDEQLDSDQKRAVGAMQMLYIMY